MPSIAANDDLSPFEEWWVSHGGAPDLGALGVSLVIRYEPDFPTGNLGVPIGPDEVAPLLTSACFNGCAAMTLDGCDQGALNEWAALVGAFGGEPWETTSRTQPWPPRLISWGPEELEALWARRSQAIDQVIETTQLRNRLRTYGHGQPLPPSQAARVAHVAQAAWERFRTLPLVRRHPCGQAHYLALAAAQRDHPEGAYPTIEQAYEAQVTQAARPPAGSPALRRLSDPTTAAPLPVISGPSATILTFPRRPRPR